MSGRSLESNKTTSALLENQWVTRQHGERGLNFRSDGRTCGLGGIMIRSIAAVLVASSLPLALASATDEKGAIPQFELAGVGWSKVSDDFLPPASGPGPVTYDKARPYIPNNNAGRQVTFRIADLTNPILKPWAIEKMREQNELAAAGKRAYEARASCRPGGVPGYLVMGRVNPLYFVQGKNVVVMI